MEEDAMKRLALVCVALVAIMAVATSANAQCASTKYTQMSADMLLGWGAWNGTDRDWNGIPDEFDGALACVAMCEDPAIQAIYDANLATAHALVDGDSDWWMTNYFWTMYDEADLQMAAYAMWDTNQDMILWYWWYGGSMSGFTLVPGLADGGDYDGDGISNLNEYRSFVVRGGTDPLAYAALASTPTTMSCSEWWYDYMTAAMAAGWGGWNGNDRDWDNVPDEYMGALTAEAICDDPAIEAAFEANLAAVHTLIDGDNDAWFNAYGWAMDDIMADQIALYAMWDSAMNMPLWYYWVPDASGLASVPSLVATADYDEDGSSNLAEYEGIVFQGGGPAAFGVAASDPDLLTAMPVAGLLGLALLAASCIASGALTLRKK
jgi:hypothetical protein